MQVLTDDGESEVVVTKKACIRNDLDEHDLYSPESRRSEVWQHFKLHRTIKDKAFCNVCKIGITQVSSSTTNLSKHLLMKHSIKTETSSKPKKMPNDETNSAATSSTLTTLWNRKVPYPRDHHKQTELTKMIAKFIYTDMQPISVVEDPGFKELMAYVDPKYQMPSRTHMMEKVLRQEFQKKNIFVRESLSEAKAVSLTTDAWTSRATDNYITVTAHAVMPDWSMKSFVLSTKLSNESHTSEFLLESLTTTISEWNLEAKLANIYVTTDNARNITKALENSTYIGVRCFAHSMNLTVQRGLADLSVNEALKRIRRIITHYHKSPLASGNLKVNINLP